MKKEEVAEWFKILQDQICNSLEKIETGKKFSETRWDYNPKGGGRSRVIEGEIFEKGGVNFSEVSGPVPEALKENFHLSDKEFFATGVSLVIHPQNPFVPIVHMNVRYFESGKNSWFGGGIDLTPIYIDKDDAKNFHHKLKAFCDKHSRNYYIDFKKWADDYFYIEHRKETRGIGGIFFDRLSGNSLENTWNFVKDVGSAFTEIYIPIVITKKDLPFNEHQKQWQLIRRGRYVEFNLVYDKGTKFGLITGGRTESILMSLPPLASWKYEFSTEEGSAEEETTRLLRKNIDWINI